MTQAFAASTRLGAEAARGRLFARAAASLAGQDDDDPVISEILDRAVNKEISTDEALTCIRRRALAL